MRETVKTLAFVISGISGLATSLHATKAMAAQGATDLSQYVDPFIGTGGHGHTFPGASAPFGMVQLSPDTRIDGWDSCAGYHSSDDSIMGFSHTHLSGTGVPDYSDILVMPSVGTSELDPGPLDNPDAGFRSRFSKRNEVASPGYYRVILDDYGIEAELTASPRVGFHRYRFPQAPKARIFFDLQHRSNQHVTESFIEVVSSTEIKGYRRSSDWARDQRVYFYAQLSKPMQTWSLYSNNSELSGAQRATGKNIKLAVFFATAAHEEVLVKVALSPLSTEGAKANMLAEVDHWSFERLQAQTRDAWNRELGKIEVASYDRANLVKFYTAMYHSFLAPNLHMDADGTYPGLDHRPRHAADYANYTVFSLWDTYRALHPLLTIIDQKRSREFIQTLLSRYTEGGRLPVWELSGQETNTMIGYHAVSVIADAYLKGIKGFDADLALEAMKASAQEDGGGLSYYKKLGYIPHRFEVESVSKTLEYAYDDWTIAQMAKAMGRTDDEAYYRTRGQNYRKVFDPQTKLMRPRLFDGTFLNPFDPYNADHRTNGFTEANAFQYSWSVPHDVAGHMALHGGKEAYAAALDRFFTDNTPLPGHSSPDISGMIGQYAHGNEPSHHIAYLYQYADRPASTELMVRRIMDELYTTAPDGLSGNEDCGQMSAWFIFSALGFYPVAPGDNTYTFGSPLVTSATIHLENGRKFEIKVHQQSASSRQVERIVLNGQDVSRSFNHGTLMEGGVLEFYMATTSSLAVTP